MAEDRLIAFKNSVSVILETLFLDLAERGLISRVEVSGKLSDVATQIEKNWSDHPELWDVKFIRGMARALQPDYPLPVTENPHRVIADNDSSDNDPV